MRWTWDPRKDRVNQRKHGLSFATAQYVFDDPFAASRHDPNLGEQRWTTVGVIGGVTVLVVHTWPGPEDNSGEEVGRIISARDVARKEGV